MKKTLILAMIVAAACSAYGTVLTPDQALGRVMQSGHAMQGNGVMRIKSKTQFDLALTVKTGDEPGCYVFNKTGDNGYIVLSADDLAPAVLGYSDHGTFDGDNMPPALKYWLDTYAQQIDAARATGATIESSLANVEDFEPIAPMVTTKWGQEYPYNLLCPFEQGNQCVTGCLPTALAQVINYRKYPERGIGTHSYKWNDQTLSFNYGNTVFEWDNMLNNYGGDATDVQRYAVAALMYACGVGVEAYYGYQFGTSASDEPAPRILVDNFGYDEGLHLVRRKYYTLSEWQKILQEELRTNGPTMYCGMGSGGGHAFVCDGYSGDGYYHFNWGWEGMSDNYYLITALNPPMQGTGGVSNDYNGGQSILVGVCKPKEGSKPVEQMWYEDNFLIESPQAQLGGTVRVDGDVCNYSIVTLDVTMGLKLEGVNGEVIYAEAPSSTVLGPENALSEYEVTIPSTLSDGTYKATPVFKTATGGEWASCLVPIACAQHYTAEVSGGVVNFESAEYPTIEVSNIQTPEFYISKKFRINLTLTNPTDMEYYGGLYGVIVNKYGQVAAYSNSFFYDLMPGESVDTVYVSKFMTEDGDYNFEAGKYYLFLVDQANYDDLIDPIEITMRPAWEAPSVNVNELGLVGGGNVVKDKAAAEFEAAIYCPKGTFEEELYLVIFEATTKDAVTYCQTNDILIKEDEEKMVTFDCDLSECEPNVEYIAVVYYEGFKAKVSGKNFSFTVSDEAGIESVEADGDANAPLYNLQGIRVDKPAPGIYIRGGKKVLITQ